MSASLLNWWAHLSWSQALRIVLGAFLLLLVYLMARYGDTRDDRNR